MLFNSLEFALFLPIVFYLYWFVFNKNLKLQNLFMLAASYLFYGWWDWRFLSLIFISTTLDFSIGVLLGKYTKEKTRKAIISISFIANLGLLGFFKYFNFFIESFTSLLTSFGLQANEMSLRIILPVGISFYTFQSLSYTIDVFRRKLEPTKDPIAFFAFVSFFPQLVAGPIERATNLLPQFYVKRSFDFEKAVDGLRQMLWGLFKKVVIADNCATYANEAFNNYQDYSGLPLILGAIFFAFQIYCDFSGYSDIAIGTARLFGFSLMRNFAFPYFSRDIAEFWRRWHISLSTWFRDYLYIPLGGSKGNRWQQVRNTFIVFTVSGFWHGANWTFIIWGALNAVYFLPLLLLKQNRRNLDTVSQGRVFPSMREAGQIFFTFSLTSLAWVFFRANSVTDALDILRRIFTSTHQISIAEIQSLSNYSWKIISLFLFIILLVTAEWLQRDKQHALQFDTVRIPRITRWGFYYLIAFLIIYFRGMQQDFIYFQF